jgi:hypothetical protein
MRKNGTANTIEFFVGGVKLASVAYTNEPTGGSSAFFRMGEDGTGDSGSFWPAHYAFYDGVLLSDERIMIHAVAAGLQGQVGDSQSLGFKDVPSAGSFSTVTLNMSHRGKHVSVTGNVTIPANSSVAFPIGTEIWVYNNSSSSITIALTTDTLRLVGTATTGSRTLAQRGLARLFKVNTTEWVASGVT